MSGSKQADLAGPGISTYEAVDHGLPTDYSSLLSPKETQRAIMMAKQYIEEGLCRELNLFRVECPMILTKDSGMNDYLDRDGSRTPVDFPAGLGISPRLEVQVVQAATKWKRWALKQFGKMAASLFLSTFQSLLLCLSASSAVRRSEPFCF
mmetsp:Transcript_24957/g.54496  ORF Transcript_24957/g.54496 Transcript_24957/m.54496 type:complete len:151 (+) Transcript_24957:142-594(+)